MSKISRKKTNCYCINLRRATNAITEQYDRQLEPLNLTVSQFSLLINLSQLGVCSVSDLANYVGLQRTTLVRSLKPLFALNYIKDTAKEGKRKREIQLTSFGKNILEQANPLWQKAQDEIEQKIGKENLNFLLEILSSLEEK